MSKGKLIDALKGFTERNSGVKDSVICTVKSVDVATKTCYCEPINGMADIKMVMYQPNSAVDGYVIIPKDESIVVVSYMNDYTPYISMFSEVEEIHLAGVAYGGLAKTADLTTKLNNLENKVNSLITAMNTHVHAGVTIGAGVTGLGSVPIVGTLTPTTQANISSTKVFHGDNT